MNQTEKKYTIRRIEEITNRCIKEFERKFKSENTVPAKYLSNKEKLTLIHEGTVKLREFDKALLKTGTYSNLTMSDVFDFSGHEQIRHVKNRDKMNKAVENMANHCVAAKDKIMLGSSDEALTVLSSLEETLKTLSEVE